MTASQAIDQMRLVLRRQPALVLWAGAGKVNVLQRLVTTILSPKKSQA
jgi:hypothetical protein